MSQYDSMLICWDEDKTFAKIPSKCVEPHQRKLGMKITLGSVRASIISIGTVAEIDAVYARIHESPQSKEEPEQICPDLVYPIHLQLMDTSDPSTSSYTVKPEQQVTPTIEQIQTIQCDSVEPPVQVTDEMYSSMKKYFENFEKIYTSQRLSVADQKASIKYRPTTREITAFLEPGENKVEFHEHTGFYLPKSTYNQIELRYNLARTDWKKYVAAVLNETYQDDILAYTAKGHGGNAGIHPKILYALLDKVNSTLPDEKKITLKEMTAHINRYLGNRRYYIEKMKPKREKKKSEINESKLG